MSVTKRLRKTTLISKKKGNNSCQEMKVFLFWPVILKMQETLFVILLYSVLAHEVWIVLFLCYVNFLADEQIWNFVNCVRN